MIELPQNGRQAKARNIGIRAAKGSIVAYLDSDNSWDERYLAANVGAFARLPQADAIYSADYLYRNETEGPFAVRYGHFNRALLENSNFIDTNSIAHRARANVDEIQFDQSLLRFEDYDLALRLSEDSCLMSVPIFLTHYHFDVDETNSQKNFDAKEARGILHARMQSRYAARQSTVALKPPSHPVTAVIPNWQSLAELRNCLSSLYEQGWNDLLQVIVVDNASDPATVAYLRQEQEQGRISLIENSRNHGFTYTVNQGIAASRAQSDIFLLNNDAELRPHALISLQDAACRLKDAGILVPRQILPAGSKAIKAHVPFASELRECDINLSTVYRNIEKLPVFHDSGPIEATWAPFFAAYIRRDVIDKMGLLDAEHGRHHLSDRLYCEKMRLLMGRKVYYVPDARVDHRGQIATKTLAGEAERSDDIDWLNHKQLGRRNTVRTWLHKARLGHLTRGGRSYPFNSSEIRIGPASPFSFAR